MKKFQLAALFCLLLVVLVGCGKPKVTGTVTFSDGTILKKGTVNFTDGAKMCKGEVKDGKYEMRTFKPGDGVIPGTYKVYITDTLVMGAEIDTGKKTGDVEVKSIGASQNFVDPKYAMAETSGLTITVDKSMKYDIVLEGGDPSAQDQTTEAAE